MKNNLELFLHVAYYNNGICYLKVNIMRFVGMPRNWMHWKMVRSSYRRQQGKFAPRLIKSEMHNFHKQQIISLDAKSSLASIQWRREEVRVRKPHLFFVGAGKN